MTRPTIRPAPPVVLPAAPVTQEGHRLLGVTAGWDLLGYGPDQVVRIEFARGRIVRTAIPPLLSSGPLSFVVGSVSWLIMQCQDHRRCSDMVVNSATGVRHVLPGRAPGPSATPLVIGGPGVIAPDGSAAALLRAGPDGQTTLQLVNLMNGRDHRIDVPLYRARQASRRWPGHPIAGGCPSLPRMARSRLSMYVTSISKALA